MPSDPLQQPILDARKTIASRYQSRRAFSAQDRIAAAIEAVADETTLDPRGIGNHADAVSDVIATISTVPRMFHVLSTDADTASAKANVLNVDD